MNKQKMRKLLREATDRLEKAEGLLGPQEHEYAVPVNVNVNAYCEEEAYMKVISLLRSAPVKATVMRLGITDFGEAGDWGK